MRNRPFSFFKRVIITNPFTKIISEKFGTTKMSMLKECKNPCLFNWEKAFENLSINEKVVLLSKTLLNIFGNYNPNKIVKCIYRDPPWITKQIKSRLKKQIQNNKIVL